jgi:hypothetical protein
MEIYWICIKNRLYTKNEYDFKLSLEDYIKYYNDIYDFLAVFIDNKIVYLIDFCTIYFSTKEAAEFDANASDYGYRVFPFAFICKRSTTNAKS